MRNRISRALSAALRRRVVAVAPPPATSVVFAPHPDDETLGCGGTIVRRLRRGTRVIVVFLTDGRVSHEHLMQQDELVALRIQEAHAACRALGVAAQDVHLLGFCDGRLHDQRAAAIEQVAALLAAFQPDEVFVPHHAEEPADHRATYAIVQAALCRLARPTIVYEYAVWAWHHWPWVGLPLHNRRMLLSVIKQSFRYGFGLGMLREFNHIERIDDVGTIKRAALDQHVSQMQRLIPDPGWATLADVADGEFLERFFDGYEPFRRTVITTGGS